MQTPRRRDTTPRPRSLPLGIALGMTLLGAPSPLHAQPRATLVASSLSSPLLVTAPAGDAARIFVVEQGGRVRVAKGGAVAGTFLDLSSRVSCCGERGLLGLAFHPRYLENGRFFVNYTDTAGNSVVAEYRATSNPDLADPASERVLLRQTQPFANHNGGNLAFSPVDGFLYAGLGDGGSGGDPQNNAQNEGTWLGKLLRLDVDRQDAGKAYAVPPDNPQATAGSPRAEQWAKGLRNPWRFAFDRLSGDLCIGDVGQGAREEVDYQRASSRGGENYGWRLMEGTACYTPSTGCVPAGVTLVLPVHEYTHASGRCSLTGGPFVRSAALPELDGRLLFGDYCTGEVFSLRMKDGAAVDVRNHTAEIAPGGGRRINQISSFGEDALGNVYVCDIADGEVYRIDSTGQTSSRSVPVVVDVPGRFGSRFRTSLAVANTGTSTAALSLRYTAADSLGASGSGTITDNVPAGGQLLVPDVVSYLRQKGLAIPEGDEARNAGTLRVDGTGAAPSGSLRVAARTTTVSGNGRAGVSYGAPRPTTLFDASALVFGLRESVAERSNLALVNAGPDALRLRLTFQPSAGGLGPWATWPEEIVLGPGQWRQLDSPLAALGLAGGAALVERTGGEGPFDAYAVVNDNATNDGSFLPGALPIGPREEVVVPVVVETSRFDSELVLHNPGDADVTATLRYVESLASPSAAAVEVTEVLPGHAQRILPRLLDAFRARGAAVGPRGGSYAGSLTVSFRTADGRPAAGLAAVRVSAPEPAGGSYGVFLSGIPFSRTSIAETHLVGLTQDASSRSNVAVVHAGGSPDPITLRLDVLAPDGRKAGEIVRTLTPGQWAQEDGVLSRFGLSAGRVRVVKTAGSGRFLAYGVVNDGGTPETGTSDGSALLGE